MLPTAEMIAKVAEWRAKLADGSITQDEMKAAIVYMRGGRLKALEASASAKKSTKVKVSAKSADDLLSELGLLKSGI